jgi:hypothetical protein
MKKILTEWRKYLAEQEEDAAPDRPSTTGDPNNDIVEALWDKVGKLSDDELKKLKNIVHNGSHLGRKIRHGKQLQPAGEDAIKRAGMILSRHYTTINRPELAKVYKAYVPDTEITKEDPIAHLSMKLQRDIEQASGFRIPFLDPDEEDRDVARKPQVPPEWAGKYTTWLDGITRWLGGGSVAQTTWAAGQTAANIFLDPIGLFFLITGTILPPAALLAGGFGAGGSARVIAKLNNILKFRGRTGGLELYQEISKKIWQAMQKYWTARGRMPAAPTRRWLGSRGSGGGTALGGPVMAVALQQAAGEVGEMAAAASRKEVFAFLQDMEDPKKRQQFIAEVEVILDILVATVPGLPAALVAMAPEP